MYIFSRLFDRGLAHRLAGCARLPVALLAHWVVGQSSSAVALGPGWVRLPLRLLLAHWEPRVIWIVEELAFEVLLLIWRASAKCEAQELICSPGLHVLLVEQVKK